MYDDLWAEDLSESHFLKDEELTVAVTGASTCGRKVVCTGYTSIPCERRNSTLGRSLMGMPALASVTSRYITASRMPFAEYPAYVTPPMHTSPLN